MEDFRITTTSFSSAYFAHYLTCCKLDVRILIAKNSNPVYCQAGRGNLQKIIELLLCALNKKLLTKFKYVGGWTYMSHYSLEQNFYVTRDQTRDQAPNYRLF